MTKQEKYYAVCNKILSSHKNDRNTVRVDYYYRGVLHHSKVKPIDRFTSIWRKYNNGEWMTQSYFTVFSCDTGVSLGIMHDLTWTFLGIEMVEEPMLDEMLAVEDQEQIVERCACVSPWYVLYDEHRANLNK